MQEDRALDRGRRGLLRGTVFYGALVAGDAALLYYIVTRGVSGIGYVSLAVVLLFGVLLLTQLVGHVRDVASAPVTTEGEILRKWQRAELIIAWPSYFIQIERKIFKIEAQDFVLLEEGRHARVRHFPHTLNVLEVERVAGAPAESMASKEARG